MKRKVRLCVLGLLATVLVAVSIPASAETCGHLAMLKGRVEILRLKQGTESSSETVRNAFLASEGAPLDCRDIVLTGPASRAKLDLKTAKLTMGPHSRIEIARHTRSAQPSLLNLTYGKVRAFFDSKAAVQERSRQTSDKKAEPSGSAAPGSPSAHLFRIRTVTAVTGVRGTDFYVSFEPISGITEQATLAGAVEVEQVASGEKVIVEPGMQVAVIPPAGTYSPPSELTQTPGLGQGQSSALVQNPLKPVPLKLEPISERTIQHVKQTSILAKSDRAFTTMQAIKILGDPAKWEAPKEELPVDLKDIKNEF